jgi:hypothetical protein
LLENDFGVTLTAAVVRRPDLSLEGQKRSVDARSIWVGDDLGGVASNIPAYARDSAACKSRFGAVDVSWTPPLRNVFIANNETWCLAGASLKPSDGLEPSTPSLPSEGGRKG